MAAKKRSKARAGARKSTKGTTNGRSAARRTSRSPDAIGLLKEDHRTVEDLFARFEKARGESQKEKLASQICAELKIHAQIEEEIFYPAVREAIDDSDLMNEAEIEHASAKALIAQIENASPSDEKFDSLVTVLSEYIKHHVKEEEGEMFKKVRASELDLADLAMQLQERKSDLQESPAESAPRPSNGRAASVGVSPSA
jgi:hemerythrin superfamily protein